MQQRHLLRAARRAARVQEERHVVGARQGWRSTSARGDREHLDARRGGGGARGREPLGRQEQGARLQIVEIERELVLRVCGVERCSGRAAGEHAEEELEELRAVRLGESDAIAGTDAGRGEGAREGGCRIAQALVGQPAAVRNLDGGGTGVASLEQRQDRIHDLETSNDWCHVQRVPCRVFA